MRLTMSNPTVQQEKKIRAKKAGWRERWLTDKTEETHDRCKHFYYQYSDEEGWIGSVRNGRGCTRHADSDTAEEIAYTDRQASPE
jgi:hypothetical protein